MRNIGIILAAGRGSRMKSARPKALQPLVGRALIAHLIVEAQKVYDALHVVIAPDMHELREALEKMATSLPIPFAIRIQKEPKGTGDAGLAGLEGLKDTDNAVFLYADNPLLTAETMKHLSSYKDEKKADLALVGMQAPGNQSYGRVVLDHNGRVKKVVEYKEATPEQKQITLCNGGVISGNVADLNRWLSELAVEHKSKSGEIYLTDIIEKASAKGTVVCIEASEEELIGINSRVDLAKAEDLVQKRLRLKAMEAGAHLRGQDTIFLSLDTEIGRDVTIDPHVVFEGRVKIKDGAHIRSFSHLADCEIGENSVIGPYARLRPGTVCDKDVHLGNFVEVKNSHLEEGVKVSHLSYLGDTDIGAESNIGGGTITCNYDGFKKHRTKIGKKSFIGSHATLVAPIEIGAETLIAAGSVITSKVPDNALAFGRARQETKEQGAKRWRESREDKK